LRRSVESATLLGHWLFLPRLVSLHNLLLALGFVRRPRIADPRVSRKPFMRFIAMWTVGLPEKYRAAVPWSAQQPASSRPWDCSTRISCPMSQHLGEHLTDHFGVLDHVIFDNAGDLFRVAREIVPHDRSYQRHCSQRRPVVFLAAPSDARESARRCHISRVLRLQLRLLQAGTVRYACTAQGRSKTENCSQGISYSGTGLG
jgi:hypothetical protein